MATTLGDVTILADLLASGAGVIVDAQSFPAENLMELASRANKGPLILRNAIAVDITDLREIARRGGGHVILDFTR